jgi:DNA-binding MarR family transcriptional regulator
VLLESNLSDLILRQQRYFNNQVQRAVPKWQTSMKERQSGIALGHGQSAVLRRLLERDGVSLKTLGQSLQIRPASIGELVSKLEESGLTERRISIADGRVSEIFLTDKGRQSAVLVEKERRGIADKCCSGLSEEEKELFYTLSPKLTTELERLISEENE